MSDFTHPITCEQFEERISDYIDGALLPADRAMMDAHAQQCAACRATLAAVSTIVRDAAVMPLLTPSRDLWSGIADRLDTPVVSISVPDARAAKSRRTISFRMFAAAAALLVTVSSGATYLFTRAQREPTGLAAALQVAGNTSPAVTAATIRTDSSAVGATPTTATRNTGIVPAGGTNAAPDFSMAGRPRTRYAANDGNAVDLVYEREITAMRRIVDERLGDLDSNTVVEIERNLRIIDKAINDSRRALQNDPRSRFLSSQLDRALENKLDVLRRLALL